MIFEKVDSKVAGFFGVVTIIFSTYKLSENTLSFGPAGATRKMCPDMSVEDLFFSEFT